jgi:stage II sporulation protein D
MRAGTTAPAPVPARGKNTVDAGQARIRVLLSPARGAQLWAAHGLTATDAATGQVIASTSSSARVGIEQSASELRLVTGGHAVDDAATGSILVRGTHNEPIVVGGRSYRGTLEVAAGAHDPRFINELPIDEYLLGVVPRELGSRAASDSAAAQAQAVAARSYAYVHLSPRSAYDVTDGTSDQVYGGVVAENAFATAAVVATRGLVLEYDGQVVNAPYHSTCGGSTAAASEVWNAGDEPYLKAVSDRIPGTNRYYCDISPRFAWKQTLNAKTVNAEIERYLATYAKVPGGVAGAVQTVQVTSRTPSGRVGTLMIQTDRGRYELHGNDIRYVLRAPGGAILGSTSFSVDAERGRDGALEKLTIDGHGFGHGIGMCQWGAIGRSRAGQSFLTILATYYPGTTVAWAPARPRNSRGSE